MAVLKQAFFLSKLFKNLKITNNVAMVTTKTPNLNFHSSSVKNDLMEFFDDKKNWNEREVKVGRSWRIEELRIKSNSDLHKLWYVLLKEKNMLLTMDHHYKEQWAAFPNPERLDKVEESMENLEKVVRERNKAYWQLEVGETGERPTKEEIAFTGLKYTWRMRQHRIPEELNAKHRHFKRMLNQMDDKPYQKQFLSLYREKLWNERRHKRNRDFNHVCGLFKRFSNLDIEAIRKEFPDVDLDRVRRSVRTRGHRGDNIV